MNCLYDKMVETVVVPTWDDLVSVTPGYRLSYTKNHCILSGGQYSLGDTEQYLLQNPT